mmetsp:Transcript_74512/g.216088  ORF Transcript_74512/g.216088 Transcript_74512/m.216088 type:complete len:302 (+) Transcript_74512:608-1513(+)
MQHGLREVARGHDPIVVDERVADLLGPTVVELPAAIVVVAQATDPRLVRQPAVHAAPHLAELRRGPPRGDEAAALLLNASPIEAVPDIEHILRIAGPCALSHDIGDQLLSLVVDPIDILAVLRALVSDAARVRRRVVPGHRGAPIADGEDVRDAAGALLHRDRPPVLDAVVRRGHGRRPEAPGCRGVVARVCGEGLAALLACGLLGLGHGLETGRLGLGLLHLCGGDGRLGLGEARGLELQRVHRASLVAGALVLCGERRRLDIIRAGAAGRHERDGDSGREGAKARLRHRFGDADGRENG